MGPQAEIGRARVSLKLSRPPFSRVTLLGLRRDFSPARGQRCPDTAESGGAEVNEGRRLVPQAFSEDVHWGLPLGSILGLLALPYFVIVVVVGGGGGGGVVCALLLLLLRGYTIK